MYAQCLAELLDTIVAAVVPCRSAHGGIEALVRAYLAFTREHRDRALFVHAQAHASFVPAHGPAIAAARTPRLEALQALACASRRRGAARSPAGATLRDAGRGPCRRDRAPVAHWRSRCRSRRCHPAPPRAHRALRHSGSRRAGSKGRETGSHAALSVSLGDLR